MLSSTITPDPLPSPTPPLQSRQQKRAKRLEDLQAGKQKPLVEDPSQLDEELSKWVVWESVGKCERVGSGPESISPWWRTPRGWTRS